MAAMTFEEKVALIEEYWAAVTNTNIERMLECLHDNVVFENITDGESTCKTRGKKELEDVYVEFFKNYSNMFQVVSNFLKKGDDIVVVVYAQMLCHIDSHNPKYQAGKIAKRLGVVSEFSFTDGRISRLLDIN